MTIQSAGYIISANEGIIYAIGRTVDAAWAAFADEMAAANIRLLGDDEDSTEQDGSWARESDFVAHPATAALLTAVAERGGDIGWHRVGLVTCTQAEYDEASE